MDRDEMAVFTLVNAGRFEKAKRTAQSVLLSNSSSGQFLNAVANLDLDSLTTGTRGRLLAVYTNDTH